MNIHLQKAFTELPFSLLISGNLIAEIKNEMKEAGADAFPAIALEGRPGCGKTAIARATLFHKEGSLNFTDSRREIKKRLQQYNDDWMILIDDFPDNNSYTLREKNMSVLEESVRESYRGEGPIILITIETGAVSRLAKSCKDRMIFVSGEMVLEDKEKQAILYYLQENPDELRKTLEKFHIWNEKHSENLEFMQKLRAFREEHSCMDFRSASLLFQYKSAMNLFLIFLKEQCGVDIPEKVVMDNIMTLWNSQRIRKMDEGGTVKMLFDQMINDNVFDIYEPEAWNLCEHYCKDNCPENSGVCQGMDEECYYLKEGYFYDPEQLILVNQQSAVLIRCPDKICGFPKYGSKKPFLIVDAESLTAIFNSLLDQFCNQNNMKLPYFSAKQLRKLLFDENLCFYRLVADGHKVYTFRYESIANPNISVVLLRLSNFQADFLSKSAKKNKFLSICRASFSAKLREMTGSMHTLAGETS